MASKYLTAFSFPLLLCSTAIAQIDSLSLLKAWVKDNSIPLTSVELELAAQDLQPLKNLTAQAEIVALGEPYHGIHEFLQFRNRLTRFLVEVGGVTALAAETGYTESIAVDDYILGRGELTNAVVASVFSWGMPDSYAENKSLLEWLRSYNDKKTTPKKVHFYGIDITGGRGGQFTEVAQPFSSILSYLEKVDTAKAKTFKNILTPYLPKFNSNAYDSLSSSEKNALTATIDDIVSLFERHRITWAELTPDNEYDQVYHEAVVMRQLDANFRGVHVEDNRQAQREVAMAQNLGWAVAQGGNTGKILLYEANWHISKGPMFSDRWGSALGEYLHAMFGDRFFSIAAVFGHGEVEKGKGDSFPAPAGSGVAALLAQCGPDPFILNLRNLPADGPVGTWFTTQRPLEGPRVVDNMDVAKSFDAILFINTIHPASVVN
jgi:erythromycin esterase